MIKNGQQLMINNNGFYRNSYEQQIHSDYDSPSYTSRDDDDYDDDDEYVDDDAADACLRCQDQLALEIFLSGGKTENNDDDDDFNDYADYNDDYETQNNDDDDYNFFAFVFC